MKALIRTAVLCIMSTLLIPVAVTGQKHLDTYRSEALQWVDRNSGALDAAAKDIWSYAETAFTEYKSAERLSNLLEQNGFTVERGVADIPMAFVATYGSGSPVIGVLGEIDALPGLSQKAGVPYKEAIEPGGPGHGCGHNLLGVGGAAAAMAAKFVMETHNIDGTVKFFGCPAEETGDGKVYMARDGLFDDLDLCFDWHPGSTNAAILQTTTAVNDFEVTFSGKTAHAAGDPWNGRSALDAVELMNTGVNFLREHMKPTVRIHYVITEAGMAPNVVPDVARVWYYVRDIDRRGVEEVYARILKIAEGAALMTDTGCDVYFNSGVYNYICNRAIAKVLHRNLEYVGAPQFTAEEQEFARELQRNLEKNEDGLSMKIEPLKEPQGYSGGGSTDAADVSWIIPTARIRTSCWPAHTPGHSWGVVTCTGMSIGFKGMRTAAKTIAASVIETLLDQSIIEQAQKEFRESTKDFEYKSALSQDQKPRIPERKNR